MSYNEGKLGKKRGLPVLIDVDGIVANFCGRVSEYIEGRFGIEVDQSKIYGDIRDEANGLWDDECESLIRAKGFARTIPEFPGSVEEVKKIMSKFDVVFVTSPYGGSQTWAFDRYMWLRDRFQISRDDVIFARDKRFVSGATLIDDRYENVVDWTIFQKTPAMLLERPWNLNDRDKCVINGDHATIMPYAKDGSSRKAVFLSMKDWNKVHAYLDVLK